MNRCKTQVCSLKQIKLLLLDSFDLKKYFRALKMKIRKKNSIEFSGVYGHEAFLPKMTKFGLFWGFQNFQNLIFLSFLVFHQKYFFSVLQNNFCSSKKNFGSETQKLAKILTCFGGGEKTTLFSPPQEIKQWISPGLS